MKIAHSSMRCFEFTYPLIVGGSNGDTEITTFIYDESDAIIYGGTTNDTSLGTSSPRPILGSLAYGGYQQFLFSINKGTTVVDISKQDYDNNIFFVIDSSPLIIGQTTAFDAPTLKAWSILSTTTIQVVAGGLYSYTYQNYEYFNIALLSNSDAWQVMRYNSSGSVLVFSGEAGQSGSRAYVSMGYGSYQIVGGIIVNSSSVSYASVTMINLVSGALQWHYGINQGISPSNYYYVRRLGAISSSSLYIAGCAENNDTSGDILLFQLTLISVSGIKQPSTSIVWQYSPLSGNKMYCVGVASGMSYLIYDAGTYEMIYAQVVSSTGVMTYQVMDTMQDTSSVMTSSLIISLYGQTRIYYGGKTNTVSQSGDTIKNYTYSQGFIMTFDDNNTCLNFNYSSETYFLSNYISSFTTFTEPLSFYQTTFISTTTLAGGSNTTDPNWAQNSWCSSKQSISIESGSQADIYVYSNVTIQLPYSQVTGNTSECSDFGQLNYQVYKSDNASSLSYSYISFKNWNNNVFQAEIKYLSELGTLTLDLKSTSVNWLVANAHFKVIFEDMCGPNANVTEDYLIDMSYIVSQASQYQTISNFSVQGLIDETECFIDDTKFSLSIVPNSSAISLYKTSYIRVTTSDFNDIGNYTVTVIQPLNINDYLLSSSIVVQITDNCTLSTIKTSTISTFYYDINEFTNNTIDDTVWTQLIPWCDSLHPIYYTWTISPDTTVIQMNGNKNISIYTYSESDIAAYAISVTGTIYDLYLLSIYAQSTVNFAVEVTNNCPTASITTQALSPCCNYTVGRSQLAMQFSEWTIGYSYCLTPWYVAQYSDTGYASDYYSFIVFDNTTKEITVQTDDILMSGDYPMTIIGTFPNGSSSTYNFTISIINPCPTATLSYTQQALQSYILQDYQKDIYSNIYASNETSAICGDWVYIYGFGTFSIPDLTTSNSSNYFSIYSVDALIAGNYTITVTAYQGVNGSINSLKSTFQLQIIDSCRSTNLSASTIANYTQNISAPAIVISFTKFTDSLGICGAYTYVATLANGQAYNTSIFTFDFTHFTISVYTDEPSNTGTYDLAITGTMPYSYGSKTEYFTVYINCVVQVISSPTLSANSSYFLGQGNLDFVFEEFIQWPACGYTFSYYLQPSNGAKVYQNSLSSLPSSFTFYNTSQKLSINSNSYSDVGIYSIAVNGTLQDQYATSSTPLYYEIILITGPPAFVTQLQNLTMYAGSKTTYDLPVAYNAFGQTALIQPFMGTVQFIQYSSSIMVVKPSLKDIGIYLIPIVVSDATYSFISRTYIWKVTVIQQNSAVIGNIQICVNNYNFIGSTSSSSSKNIIVSTDDSSSTQTDDSTQSDDDYTITSSETSSKISTLLQSHSSNLSSIISAKDALTAIISEISVSGSVSLQQLWGLINTLQVLTCLPAFGLIFPQNGEYLLSMLQSTANFQSGFTQRVVDEVFSGIEGSTNTLSAGFTAMGFQTSSIIMNIGLIIIVGGMLCFIALLLLVLKLLTKRFPL